LCEGDSKENKDKMKYKKKMKIDEAYQQTLSYFFYISIQGRGTKYNITLFKLFKRKASEPKEKFK
jgi:hypothetical protein